jgi:lysine-specific permease
MDNDNKVNVYTEESVPEYHSSSSVMEAGGDQESSPLKRDLKSRHITMISIGGVIGQGLFLSSGGALAAAGPAGLLIAYAIIGFIVFWVTFALGMPTIMVLCLLGILKLTPAFAEIACYK